MYLNPTDNKSIHLEKMLKKGIISAEGKGVVLYDTKCKPANRRTSILQQMVYEQNKRGKSIR